MNTPHWQALTSTPNQTGESPFWHPQEQTLYWIDNVANQLLRAPGGAGTVEVWDMPQTPGCIAPARSGGLVIALRDGMYRARHWGGELQRIVPAGYDTSSTRFNDGKADPRGRFWAGTMYEPKDAPKGSLYSLDCRPGQPQPPPLQRRLDGVTNANGLAFSPDERTLYWTDTTRHLIRAWDWDAESGQPQRERVFHQFQPKPAGWQPGQAGYGGRPDGATIDSQGNYWCAMYEGGRLLQLSPTGQVLREFPLPLRCPSMPCFGGEDLRTLYVTSSREKRPPDELQSMPLSGHVLWTRVDVPGRPVDFFVD